jgi:hypothetical protein
MAIFVAGEVVAQGTVAELATRQRSGAQVTLEVGTDADPTVVVGLLRSLPGVRSAGADPRDARLVLVTGQPDIRGRVLAELLEAGHVPWLLRDRGMRLDEIYQRYFAASTSPPEAPEGAALETGVAR